VAAVRGCNAESGAAAEAPAAAEDDNSGSAHTDRGRNVGRRMPEGFVEGHMPLLSCAQMVTQRRLKWLPRGSSEGEGRGRRVVWFLASDSTHLKSAMREKWGERVVVMPFRPSHINRKYHNKSEMYSG